MQVQIYRGPNILDTKNNPQPEVFELRDQVTDELEVTIERLEDQRVRFTYSYGANNSTTVFGNEYVILDSNFKRNIIFSVGGQLLAERYAHIVVPVAGLGLTAGSGFISTVVENAQMGQFVASRESVIGTIFQ